MANTRTDSDTNFKNAAPVRHSAKQPSDDRIRRLLKKKDAKKALKVKL